MRKLFKRGISMAFAVMLLTCLVASAAVTLTEVWKPRPEDADLYWGVSVDYPRIIELQHGPQAGTLLATFESWTKTAPVFPVFQSMDGGKSFTKLSELTDPDKVGMSWMPQMFELPVDMGTLKKGTILFAGCSVRDNSKFTLKLFQSGDGGKTWSYLSRIDEAEGKENGVYEPFFYISDSGKLVCLYCDETESSKHSQKIVMKTSTDGGQTWSAKSDVVAVTSKNMRPGMPVVTKMGNGQYIMVYEMVNKNNAHSGNPIHYRLSDDGERWGTVSDMGTKIVSADGVTPGSSPYCVWTPAGSPNGTLYVSAAFQSPASSKGSDYFISHDYGKTFQRTPHPLPYTHVKDGKYGYSNSMFVSKDGNTLYSINTINFEGTLGKTVVAKTELSQAGGGASTVSSNAPNTSKSPDTVPSGIASQGSRESSAAAGNDTNLHQGNQGTTPSKTESKEESKAKEKTATQKLLPFFIGGFILLGGGLLAALGYVLFQLKKKA